jgi:hypothetical protein
MRTATPPAATDAFAGALDLAPQADLIATID